MATTDSTMEIPFWFHDRPKWVSGITRHTTCADVLRSLVQAHARKSASSNPVSDSSIKAAANQLRLVEQWRGVERQLSDSSKILKLWSAWGEERDAVKFVVKRSSEIVNGEGGAKAKNVSQINTNSLSRKSGTLPSRGSRTRRRNSRLSSASSTSGLHRLADTIHPSVFSGKSEENTAKLARSASTNRATTSINVSRKTNEIERLMRIILTQGETIHTQLKRLQEREGLIDEIEESVHDSRTKTAGKDYLLKAYLSSDDERKAKAKSKKRRNKDESVPECLQEMIQALERVQEINGRLESTETKLSDLQCQIDITGNNNALAAQSLPDLTDVDGARKEVYDLRLKNEEISKEIDSNRHLITSLRFAFDQRQNLITKLERDVDSVEAESQALRIQLQKVSSNENSPKDPLLETPPDDLDEELFLEFASLLKGQQQLPMTSQKVFPQTSRSLSRERNFCLSNSQLYEDDLENSNGFNSSLLPMNRTGSLPRLPHRQFRQLSQQPQQFQQPSSLLQLPFQPSPRKRVTTNGIIKQLHIDPHSIYKGSILHPPTVTPKPELKQSIPSSSSSSPTDRLTATGSPGSSSSSGCYSSDKNVRFSDRDLVMNTPDLPPLPTEEEDQFQEELKAAWNNNGDIHHATPTMVMPKNQNTGQHQQKKTKSVLKALGVTDPSATGGVGAGDLDSNSDTGLSSLHSSSDEGTYVLDTLV